MTAAITDFTQFAELRRGADQNDPAVLREVAGQFEALFLQTMLKTMREASPGDPLFGKSDSHEMYQGMLDQQLAVEMASGRGIGLAEMLVRQLGGEERAKVSVDPTLRVEREYPLERTLPSGRAFPLERSGRTAAGAKEPAWSDPESFARDVWPHARRVAERLNVAPEGVLAQAALETGWGRHVMAQENGASSMNLFGIKASGSWDGARVRHSTLEFDGPVARREVAEFRAYDDVGATFDDYAELLDANPRYAGVLGQGNDIRGFADALQRGGYATDPDYADKVSRVAESDTMARVLAGLKNANGGPIEQ